MRKVLDPNHTGRFLPARERPSEQGAAMLVPPHGRGNVRVFIIVNGWNDQLLYVSTALPSLRHSGQRLQPSSRRRGVFLGHVEFHASLFLLVILQLIWAHLNLVILSKGPRPEEQGIVPLFTDPTCCISIGLQVQPPAMAVFHGCLMPDKARQYEFLMREQLYRVFHLLECDCFASGTFHFKNFQTTWHLWL